MPLLKRKRLLTASEVADLRGCSVRSLKRYVADPDDTFPKPISDAGHMKWLESDVETWLEARIKARDAQQALIRRARLRATA